MAANPYDNDLHGIPMDEESFERLMSGKTPYHYELIDGIVYDLTGSSPEHGTIAGNIFSLIRAHLRGKAPCRVHQEQVVKIPNALPR